MAQGCLGEFTSRADLARAEIIVLHKLWGSYLPNSSEVKVFDDKKTRLPVRDRFTAEKRLCALIAVVLLGSKARGGG